MYIDRQDSTFLACDPPFQAEFIDAADLEPYAAQPEYDLPREFLQRAQATHDSCFAIRDGDVLAAYGWYSTSTNHFTDELTLHFSPDWVYMYRGFTHPAYRGRRLHAIGMTLALSAYLARGFKGLVSCVEARNEASLKSVYRMGYRDFGTIYGIRVGRLLGIRHPHGLLSRQLIYCTPGCRRFGLRLERASSAESASHILRPFKV